MMPTPTPLRDALVDTAFVVLSIGLALTGLATVYVGWGYVTAGGLGLALGLATGMLANRLGLPVVATVGTGLLVFALGGGLVLPETAFAGVLPSSRTLVMLLDGAVAGWRELLTTLPPVIDSGRFAVIPYLCCFVAGTAGIMLARQTRAVLAPVAAPTLVLIVVILLGTATPASLLLQGSVFTATILVWVALRYRRRYKTVRTGETRGRRVAGAMAMVVISCLAAFGFAASPVGAANGRFVLRDHVQPPFDVSQYPSPLAGFRRFEVNQKDAVLFTVDGLPVGGRLRLAVMDTYDGTVWAVAGGHGRTSASGVFERVGARIPTQERGIPARITLALADLGGVWLPTSGAATEITFGGARRDKLASTFRYNRRTSAGVVPVTLAPADTVTMTTVVSIPPAVEKLPGMSIVDTTLPDLTGVPAELAALAVAWSGDARSDLDRIQALVTRLRSGAFSDGTVTSGVLTRPGHGAGRLREFLTAEELVGDGEQYAATLGLMLRSLGIPARVVLGVVAPETWSRAPGPSGETTGGAVTGGLITAWVEVPFAGHGWVPFDPTPPVENTPKPPVPQNQPEGTAEVIRPPVIVAQPPPLPPPPASGTEPPAPHEICRTWWCRALAWLIRYVVIPVGGAVLGFTLLCGTIMAYKWRRGSRRRRRGSPHHRIQGGWLEFIDRSRDHGVAVPMMGTRRQRAAVLGGVALGLAEAVDRAVFAPEVPSSADATAFWREVEKGTRALTRGETRWQRFIGAVNPASLGGPQITFPWREDAFARLRRAREHARVAYGWLRARIGRPRQEELAT